MIDVTKGHRAGKMLDKIEKAIKRSHELYRHNSNFITLESSLTRIHAVPVIVERNLDRITKHLWYEHCGFTKEELRAVVEEEYNAMPLKELL